MNKLTDIEDEVARYNAERRSRGDTPEQPASTPTSGDAVGDPPAATAQPTPQEAGPPRLIGVSFENHIVGSNLGNFALEPDEEKAIARIALRAIERALKRTYNDLVTHHSISKPRKLRVVRRKRGTA